MKEYKEINMPKNQPEIVHVPKENYIAVRGTGNLKKWRTVIRQPIRKISEDPDL